MGNIPKEMGTIVVLEEGVEILDTIRIGKTRIVIYRDTRAGLHHWFELEFLDDRDGSWNAVGNAKISEAIELFTKAIERADQDTLSSTAEV